MPEPRDLLSQYADAFNEVACQRLPAVKSSTREERNDHLFACVDGLLHVAAIWLNIAIGNGLLPEEMLVEMQSHGGRGEAGNDPPRRPAGQDVREGDRQAESGADPGEVGAELMPDPTHNCRMCGKTSPPRRPPLPRLRNGAGAGESVEQVSEAWARSAGLSAVRLRPRS